MAVVKAKPTSPGRRFQVKVVNKELHKGAPHKALIENQRKSKQFKDRFNEKFFRSFKLPNFPVLKFIES